MIIMIIQSTQNDYTDRYQVLKNVKNKINENLVKN